MTALPGTLGTCPPCPCRAGGRSCSRRQRSCCSSWPGARWPARAPPPRSRPPRSSLSAPRPRRSSSSTSPARSGGPGLYRLAEGKRVADAVARAGGATAPADTAAINLAAPLADGMQVLVPRRVAGGGRGSGPGAGRRASASSSATVEQLDALPGIGPVTAQKIVDYRSAHGGFRSVDDLDAIPGIGPARVEQLRELVIAVIAARLADPARARGVPRAGAGERCARSAPSCSGSSCSLRRGAVLSARCAAAGLRASRSRSPAGGWAASGSKRSIAACSSRSSAARPRSPPS